MFSTLDLLFECSEPLEWDADGVLLAVLRDNGLGAVADEWEALSERVGGFWYA